MPEKTITCVSNRMKGPGRQVVTGWFVIICIYINPRVVSGSRDEAAHSYNLSRTGRFLGEAGGTDEDNILFIIPKLFTMGLGQ